MPGPRLPRSPWPTRLIDDVAPVDPDEGERFAGVLDRPTPSYQVVVKRGSVQVPWPPNDEALNDWEDFVASSTDVVAPFALVRRAFGDDTHGWTIEVLDDGAIVAEHIRRCLDAERPASFIRLGDGEGDLLALALGRFPHLTRYCAFSRSLKHLGDGTLLASHRHELLAAYHRAIRGADAIGIPGRVALMAALNWAGVRSNRLPPRIRRATTGNFVSAAHGIAGVYEYLGRHRHDLRLSTKALYFSRFHEALLDHYPSLVDGRPVVVVACRPELQQVVSGHMGATHVEYHHVPVQAITSSATHSTGHFPDRYEELVATLSTPRAGVLHLVAAGLLGKVYCEVIRAAGGVAVDIGSVADIWSGRASRPHHPALIARHRLVGTPE